MTVVAAEGPYGTRSYAAMISCTGPDHVPLAELEGDSKNMMNGSYVPSVSSNTSGNGEHLFHPERPQRPQHREVVGESAPLSEVSDA